MKTFFHFLVSRTLLINLFIALLLAVGGLYAILSYLDDFTHHGETIAVPELVGMTMSEVDLKMDQSEFSALPVDSFYENGVIGGKILEQDPSAGYEVKQGRKIYLTISSYAPPEVKMPKLVDLSLRRATSLMQTFGLEVGELTYRPDLCSNCILEQYYNGEKIPEGQKVPKGEKIDLVVGQGLSNELIPVPYLIDFSADLATELLKTKYLNVGSLIFDQTVQTLEDSANARVYKQIPSYSEKPIIHMGGAVELFLTLDTNRIIHSVNPSDSI